MVVTRVKVSGPSSSWVRCPPRIQALADRKSLHCPDSSFNNVQTAILTQKSANSPAIVIDNLATHNTPSIVGVAGGQTQLAGSSGDVTIKSWASGRRYTKPDGTGESATGLVEPSPNKPFSLLDKNGMVFVRSRPQYELLYSENFVVVTDHGISNAGDGDQTDAINKILDASKGNPVYFPAGIYMVQGTVFVPLGSVIVGSGWSQIMGTGKFFQDMNNPNVMVKVGNPGDKGIVEITDMLFTVKGATAGAILMEWNVHEDKQGSGKYIQINSLRLITKSIIAAMWDCHFRVGGAMGSDLDQTHCQKLIGFNRNCIAASLLFHVTPKASGYFENVWAWVADQ
jgi:glucan 1,3-beta-glucosidase